MSFKNPQDFAADLDQLEELERSTMRFICQGVHQLLLIAEEQFTKTEMVQGDTEPSDLADYVGEDVTRMALDGIGTSRVPQGRLFGAIDYKVARFVFLPESTVRQALFVDSKAEKNAFNNARVQITQTSLEVRQRRQGINIAIPGRVEPVWSTDVYDYITTTAFVKYHYSQTGRDLLLRQVSVVMLPNGFLQDRYNASAQDDIWNVGPDSPAREEKFRTRVNFTKLEAKARWRVQRMKPGELWEFQD